MRTSSPKEGRAAGVGACIGGSVLSNRKHKPETNRSAFQALVLGGPPPGLIALSGQVSLGWCQLTPRNRLPWLDRVRKLRRVDNEPVWSVSCFYVRKGHRKKGVSRRLLEAAMETTRRNRVRILEAYPLDARLTGTSSWTGYVSTFLGAGFEVVTRHVPTQPIMRFELRVPSRQPRRSPPTPE